MSQEIDFIDLYEFLLRNDVTEPVKVLKNGKKHAVLIPYDVYIENLRANRNVLTAGKMPEDDLGAVMGCEIPVRDDEKRLVAAVKSGL